MRINLRRAVDVMCALSAAGLIGGILYANSADVQEKQRLSAVVGQLQRFRQAIDYHAASGESNNGRGWPTTIDPAWFGNDAPRNEMVSPDRPWVEIATQDEAAFKDPEFRIAFSAQLASFWYNPYQGIIRARVPLAINDQKSLEMYNAINGTHLDSIYAPAPPPALTTDVVPSTASAEPAHEDPQPAIPAPKITGKR